MPRLWPDRSGYNGRKPAFFLLGKKQAIHTYESLSADAKGQDAIVLRFADLLLMQAEAENEVSEGSAAAYSAIFEVRGRVLMPVVTPGLNKIGFRNEVVHERRVELCFELVSLPLFNDRRG